MMLWMLTCVTAYGLFPTSTSCVAFTPITMASKHGSGIARCGPSLRGCHNMSFSVPHTILCSRGSSVWPAIVRFWLKVRAQRLFVSPNASVTFPIYSHPTRSQWEWDGDVPRLTMPGAHRTNGLPALPITFVPLFIAHNNLLLELAAENPSHVSTDSSRLPIMQCVFQRNFFGTT